MAICCPFDSTSSIVGGVICGGSAYVDVVSDPWDGMVQVLALNEVSDGSIGEFFDRTRNHFDGTGGKILVEDEEIDSTLLPTIDEGVFCQPSQHFDGRQLIWLEQDSLDDGHDFTVSLWAKFETFYKSRTFYSRGFNDGLGNQYVLSLGHSFLNTLSASVHTLVSSVPTEILTFGSTTLTQGVWYHVGLTYGDDTLKLYVNGVLVGTKALEGDLIALGNESFLASTDNASQLEGNLQEFKLHPVARSAHWLKAEYDSFCDYFVEEGSEEPLFYW